MRNIKILLAYEGTHYLGWQKTLLGPSIESALQTILEQILQHPVSLQAASRTDAGVHAMGQVVNFKTHNPIELRKLHISLCCLLPKDIVALSVESCSDTFHPTLDAQGKEYRYVIDFGIMQYPQSRYYNWHFPYKLDLHLMEQAIPYLVGKRDYGALCNVKRNEEYANYIREVTEITINLEREQKLLIKVKGKSFLYKMVRNIVGTLVYVGCGKLKGEDVPKILEEGDRRKAGITAPAHGLSLHHVIY
jgi:tRNA pseudouridine38-40 synthase